MTSLFLIVMIARNFLLGSATPTSQPGTPKFEAVEETSKPPLDPSSIAQMQARLHAEFLQSVRSKIFNFRGIIFYLVSICTTAFKF